MSERKINTVQDDGMTPEERKKVTKKALIKIAVLIVATVVALVVYRFFMQRPEFYIVFGIYALIAAVSVIGYVIYNRGFSRNGVTREMLPTEWSEEEKSSFIEDAKKRAERSRWLLIIAFAFLFTFAFDAFDLFVIKGLLGF
jgi:flagellar basal body-associated protein FliL